MTTRRGFMHAIAAAAAARAVRGAEVDPALVKAMQGVQASIATAASDSERPIFHFHPPANWNNDPNGTLFYKGWHHLFYQLNPFGTNIANQHWGHARSQDLVNWQHLPIAIWPSSDKGERAIFSGGAIVAKDGRPRIIYTSIGHPQPEQWMAEPEDEDLLTWKKFAGNPVLTTAAHGALTVNQWRDPFLFQEAGQTYMVCGGNSIIGRGGAGQVQLYRATKDDLTEWKHLGSVFQALERETYNIECPNLFKLEDKWVLIVSPQRPCEYFVGALDFQKVKFTPETRGILDAGNAYASNISRDDRGRTILWLWGRTMTPPGHGWNGVMVLPRILSIGSDGFLRQQVPAEFETLRGNHKAFPSQLLSSAPVVLEGVRGDAVEIQAEFVAGRVGGFGFEVRRSAAGKPAAVVTLQRGVLSVGNAQSYIGNAERYKVRMFVDKRCLEVYVNDGMVALYSALNAVPEDREIAVFGRAANPPFNPGPNAANQPAPDVKLESLQAWEMKPATFNLDRFHI